MEIVLITQRNSEKFQEILPEYRGRIPSVLLGCEKDGIAAGTAGLEMTEDGCSLGWLWVDPEFRGGGIGGALLDAACREALERPAGRLTVTYPADKDWSAVMDYMLAVRGFSVMAHRYPTYRITKEQLLASPLLAGDEKKMNPHVVPLSELERFRLQELLVECRLEREYLVSHAAFGWVDPERSMVLLKDGHVMGLALVRSVETEDSLCLDLLYLRTSDAREGILLLQQTALALLRHPAGLRELSFTCMEETGMRICSRLLGEQAAQWEEFCQGTLFAELYRPGRERHV